MTGAQITCAALEAEGADLVFGYPGGAVIPLYDAIPSSNLHHVLVRFEQWAALAADGYARATGKVGVCIATSGPGRHEPCHGSGQQPVRFRSGGCDHRTSRSGTDRQRCLSGDGHYRHHAADHQAQLPGAVGRRDRPNDQGGVLPGALWPTRACSGRYSEERLSGKRASFTCRARSTAVATSRACCRTPGRFVWPAK